MAKKRDTRRRHHRRRWRRGSLGPLLRFFSVLLAVVAIVAAITLFFKVGEIQVDGNSRYTACEIVEVSEVKQGDNLVLLDKYHIAERIYTELPYVSEVSFSRKFPDLLQIHVKEKEAAFAVPGAGVWWLVNVDGKLLEPVAEDVGRSHLIVEGTEAVEPSVSCQLTLSEEAPMDIHGLLYLLDALDSRSMLDKVQKIQLDDPDILRLRYDDRFQVELYYSSDLDYKLDCLEATVSRLQPNETGTIRMTMRDDSEVRFIPNS